jgi:RNA polymerase sigma factor (sigma-70 family)
MRVPDSSSWSEHGDQALISAARAGDDGAIAELYRRHSPSAVRFARTLTDPTSAEDLASEAFANVLARLQAGRGPEVAFRAYLMTAVRNTHVSQIRKDHRLLWVEDHDDDARETDVDLAELRQESSILADAFGQLPERWQAVLWHTAVEGEDTATVGRYLDLKPNAVAALSFRARDGLRRAYLAAHLQGVRDEACRPTRELLPAYARGRLGVRQHKEVEAHLDDCRECTAGALELRGIASGIGALLAPALLGASGAGIVATSVPAVPTGLGALRGWLSGHVGGVTVATAGVAATLVIGGWILLAPAEGPAGPTSVQEIITAPSSVVPSMPSRPHGSRAPHRPPVSSTPTPSAEPTPSDPPTSSPASPASPVAPTPRPTATGTRSSTPSPSPSPSTTPGSSGRHEDLSITNPTSYFADPQHHLEMTVAALATPTYVVLDVSDYVSHTVHADRDFASTTCQAAPVRGTTHTRLTCRLVPGDLGPAPGQFAIDLVVDGPLDVTARISAPDNRDPNRTDDQVRFNQ